MASDTKNNDNYGFNNINECNVNRANIINNVQQNIITKINQILHGDEHNYYTKTNVNGVNDHSTDLWNDSGSAVTGDAASSSTVDQQQQIQQTQKKQEHTTTINKLNNYPNSNPNPHSNSHSNSNSNSIHPNSNNYRSTSDENHVQSSNNSVNTVNSFSNSRNQFNAFSNGYTPIMCPNQEQYQADYWPDKGPWHLNENKLDLPNSDRTIQLTRNQYFSNAHHAPASGKASGNSKDICGNDDKFKEDGDPWNVEAQAAFLGPNLWDKTLPYDTDLKVTHYADLDEFLSENNIPDGLPGTHTLGHSTGLNHRPSVNDSLGYSTGLTLGLGHITTKRERSPSPSDCVSPDTINPPSPAESSRDFDPRTRAFSDEELKPQPMIKKSRKQFVPDELKDDKYWARRRKNNIAAKRSRDARRQKENQIAMRARYLEKELYSQNSTLHQELEQLKQENMELRARLSKYQDA